eukprot:747096-Hanusia_phi.AAC.1
MFGSLRGGLVTALKRGASAVSGRSGSFAFKVSWENPRVAPQHVSHCPSRTSSHLISVTYPAWTLC